MAREFVLLSDIPLTPDLMAQAGRSVIPNGTGVSYRDGEITQFIDSDGQSVATVFESVPVHEPEEARALLPDPPASFGLWTEITIPFGATAAGDELSRALVEAFVMSVGGKAQEKR